MEFILGGVVFGLCLYAFLVWRQERGLRLAAQRPRGKLSAYRGELPDASVKGAPMDLALNVAALGALLFSFLVPVELLVDRGAAFMARGMSRGGAVPLPFVPAWKVARALHDREKGAEDAVERLHRLQVLVNLALMAGLCIASPFLAASPILLAALATLLGVRALHTRLLGRVARTYGAVLVAPPLEARDESDARADVPPWLSRALTRRAESRLGVTSAAGSEPADAMAKVRVVARADAADDGSNAALADAPADEESPEEAPDHGEPRRQRATTKG